PQSQYTYTPQSQYTYTPQSQGSMGSLALTQRQNMEKYTHTHTLEPSSHTHTQQDMGRPKFGNSEVTNSSLSWAREEGLTANQEMILLGGKRYLCYATLQLMSFL